MNQLTNSLPIGIFDSGMGGLTVLHELINLLPNESYLYLGDTARLPYGTKSQSTVLHYAVRMTHFLINQGIKLLVIACNTATAAALPYLQSQFPELPIIGVIEPGAKAALAATSNNHIALLATETTINLAVYQNTLKALNANVQVSPQACSLFVALAEEGCIDDEIAHCAIKKYLTPLVKQPNCCDTVILGCTHFPVLLNPIKQFLGEKITVINSAAATAKVVKETLNKLQLSNQFDLNSKQHYYVTDLPERFCRLGQIFLEHSIDPNNVELIDSHVMNTKTVNITQ